MIELFVNMTTAEPGRPLSVRRLCMIGDGPVSKSIRGASRPLQWLEGSRQVMDGEADEITHTKPSFRRDR